MLILRNLMHRVKKKVKQKLIYLFIYFKYLDSFLKGHRCPLLGRVWNKTVTKKFLEIKNIKKICQLLNNKN